MAHSGILHLFHIYIKGRPRRTNSASVTLGANKYSVLVSWYVNWPVVLGRNTVIQQSIIGTAAATTRMFCKRSWSSDTSPRLRAGRKRLQGSSPDPYSLLCAQARYENVWILRVRRSSCRCISHSASIFCMLCSRITNTWWAVYTQFAQHIYTVWMKTDLLIFSTMSTNILIVGFTVDNPNDLGGQTCIITSISQFKIYHSILRSYNITCTACTAWVIVDQMLIRCGLVPILKFESCYASNFNIDMDSWQTCIHEITLPRFNIHLHIFHRYFFTMLVTAQGNGYYASKYILKGTAGQHRGNI